MLSGFLGRHALQRGRDEILLLLLVQRDDAGGRGRGAGAAGVQQYMLRPELGLQAMAAAAS